METWVALINAVGIILLAWWKYNEHKHKVETDMKLQKFQDDMEVKKKRRNDNSALVLGELWEVRHVLDADRVYIVQPHPLGNESMVSIYFEAKRKGVESMKPHVQNLQMSEAGKFCADLASHKYLEYKNIDDDVADRFAKSLLSSCGTTSVIIRKLADNTHDWVGSIFCEFTRDYSLDETKAREILDDAATNIRFILPEFTN